MKTKRSTNRKNKSDNLTISLEQLKNQFIFVSDLSGLWTQTRSLVLLSQRPTNDNIDSEIINNFYYSIHDIDLLKSKSSQDSEFRFYALENAIYRFIFIDFLNKYLFPKAQNNSAFAGLIELFQTTQPGLFDLGNDEVLAEGFITDPVKMTFYSPYDLIENLNTSLDNTITTYELSDLVKDIYCQKPNYTSRKFKYEFKKNYPTILYVDVWLDIDDLKNTVIHFVENNSSSRVQALYDDLHKNKNSSIETLFGPDNKKHIVLNLYIDDRFIPESANSFTDLESIYYDVLKDGLQQMFKNRHKNDTALPASFSELFENYSSTVNLGVKQLRDLKSILSNNESHSIQEIYMTLQPLDPTKYNKIEIEAST